MHKLLKTISDATLNSQNDYLAGLRDSKKSVGCFLPAWDGEAYLHGIEMIDRLFKQGINFSFVSLFDEVIGAVEKDELNVPLISVSQVKCLEKKPEYIIMLHSPFAWPDAMYEYFINIGMCPLILWEEKEIHASRKYYLSHVVDIFEAYKCLDDEVSRESFLGVFKANITGQPYDRLYAEEAQYLLPGFVPSEGDIAIDGGAFDGETGKIFSDMGAIVYSFELDKQNFPKVYEMGKKYGFNVVNKGLWSCRKECKYHPGADASSITDMGTEVADLIDLDTFVRENDIPRIDYIKFDIEGAELEALKGAAISISKWKPKLAICAYHKPEDLWTLVRYLRMLRPDYKFAFRHHKTDLRNFSLDDIKRKVFSHYRMEYMISLPYESVLYAR